MIEARRQANIYDFIEKQPEGLDTMVGNRGLKLERRGETADFHRPGGPLKDPAPLIFDEATSVLTPFPEAAIQAAINPLIEERTSILIAHRLSTILAADEILVAGCGTERLSNAESIRILYTRRHSSGTVMNPVQQSAGYGINSVINDKGAFNPWNVLL